jgi:GST-like protein
VVLNRAYEAAEFLDAGSYVHLNRWANEINAREAVKRGCTVNRTGGVDEKQIRDRHDAKDIDAVMQN